jgi:anhydro-N-acetylmuramic acid kinase
MNSYSLPIVDFLNIPEHVAMQIAMALLQKTTLFITGGGAYNDFLIEEYNFTYLK